jgi:2,4-dienoyl-CoA reductase-like NADH-dependent reductase (Old Yellow Enzyme family)/thioredoxin reductase
MKYPNVFQPFQMGAITLKNRLVMSPMTMNYATEEGFATEKLIRYYLERAKGGVGLIIVEGTFFTPEGKGYMNQLGLSSLEHAEKLRDLTKAVHGLDNDANIFIQIHHAGRRAHAEVSGHQPVAPSALPVEPGGEIPHALTEMEVKDLVQAHIEAAARAQEVGFDGVDIHCAHGYLVPSFFSPLSNQRTDEYGGDLRGRTLFLLEIIRGIKDRLGKDFPLTIKISGDEFMEGGLGLEEMTQIAHLAQEEGIDGIMVSAGAPGGKKIGDLDQAHQILRTMPMMTERGCLVPLAAEMKKRLTIQVITVGRINTPTLAEEIISQGKADLVAMGRALLADPYLPGKAREGNEELIRTCIACNEGCYKRIFEQLDIRCSINPTLGHEEESPCHRAPVPKRVVVVGAGPAGLEAAHAAWERGHEVALIEINNEVGGQLNLASLPPGREEIQQFRQFLVNRLKRTDVKVITGTEATPSLIGQYNPNVIICALGSHPQSLDIPGLGEIPTVSGWDVIAGETKLQEPCLVLGAGLVGCETSDLLSEQGKEVILVEVLPGIASDGDADTKAYFTLRFQKNGVKVFTEAELKRIEGKTAVIQQGSEVIRLPVGTVILAVGAEPNDALCDELSSSGLSVEKVGDCVDPRRIIDAMAEGFRAGRTV